MCFCAVVNELVSHLPLQMLLYFNMFYFPCWWFCAVFMLEVKVSYTSHTPVSRHTCHQTHLSADTPVSSSLWNTDIYMFQLFSVWMLHH